MTATAYHFTVETFGNPRGRPVVFLHGFMGRGEDWREVATLLGDGVHALAVDLPGHGMTRVDAPDENFRMDRVAQGVVDYLVARGFTRCGLVGYSMGGRLALYLACRFPDRFDAIVIESASPGLTTEAERQERRTRDAALADRLAEIPLDRFLIEWYGQPMFSTLHENSDRYAQLLQRRRGADPAGLAASLRMMGSGSQPTLWNELGRITAPVLLITGEKDAKFRGLAGAMKDRIPASRLAIVAGAGHNVHWEQPDTHAWLIDRFFSTHESPETPA